MIGAPGRDGTGTDQGAAFAYAYAAGGWVYARTLTPPPVRRKTMPASARRSRSTQARSPSGPRPARAGQGTVYTFTGAAGAWADRQTLTVPAADPGARAGAAVAVQGAQLAVGAPDDDIGVNPAQGSVTTFAEFPAADDAYSIDQRDALRVSAPGVLSNDANPTSGTRTVELVRAPAYGNALQLNPDGSFAYIPQNDFSGADSFTYQAVLPSGRSNVATVTITVRPRPVAHPDSYSTGQDTPLVSPADTGVLANDESGSGGPLTASLLGAPAHGTLTLSPDGSFTYTPAAGYVGPDAFTYRAVEGTLGSLPATVSLTVLPPPPAPPPPPVASDDAYDTRAGTPLNAPAPTGVLANDTGGRVAALLAGPLHGTLSLRADGSFTYAPAAGYSGTDTFSYEAQNLAGTDAADVTLLVLPGAQPPAGRRRRHGHDRAGHAGADHRRAPAGQRLDADGDALSPASPLPLTNPAHGRLTVTAGAATYMPDPGFSGTDTFTYAVSDGRDSSPPATVTITVPSAGDPGDRRRGPDHRARPARRARGRPAQRCRSSPSPGWRSARSGCRPRARSIDPAAGRGGREADHQHPPRGGQDPPDAAAGGGSSATRSAV